MIMLYLVRSQAAWFEAITLGEATSAGVQSAAYSPSRRSRHPAKTTLPNGRSSVR